MPLHSQSGNVTKIDLSANDSHVPHVLCGNNVFSPDLKTKILDYYHNRVSFAEPPHKVGKHSFSRLFCNHGNTRMKLGEDKALSSSNMPQEIEPFTLDVQAEIVDHVVDVINTAL